jgi:ribosomal protein S15P/S13E
LQIYFLFLTLFVMPAKKELQKDNPFKRHEGDTGSPEFQIGLLSEEITQLQ